jgi:hypothetical protein
VSTLSIKVFTTPATIQIEDDGDDVHDNLIVVETFKYDNHSHKVSSGIKDGGCRLEFKHDNIFPVMIIFSISF